MAGFRRHRSPTGSNGGFASLLEEVSATRLPAYVIITYIHRTFDALPHVAVLPHPRHSSVYGDVLEYLTTLLYEIRFRALVYGALNAPRRVSRGVPQRSVLSPLPIDVSVAALPLCIPENCCRMPVKIDIEAIDVILWAISNTLEGSPNSAALQSVLLRSVCHSTRALIQEREYYAYRTSSILVS